MTIQEDILAKLMAEPITKFIVGQGQGDVSNLESELAERAAKI